MRVTRWKHLNGLDVLVGAGVNILKGAWIVLSAGYAVPGTTGEGLVAGGKASENADNSAGGNGAIKVHIEFPQEKVCFPFIGDPDNLFAQANIGGKAYLLDDQTVTTDSDGNTAIGTVWKIETANGVQTVWVEPVLYAVPAIEDFTGATHDHADASGGGQLDPSTALSEEVPVTLGGTGLTTVDEGDLLVADGADSLAALAIGSAAQLLRVNSAGDALEYGGLRLKAGAALVPAAGDIAIGTPGTGFIYTIPALDAATTVSLGTTGSVAGDVNVFVADGTNNDETTTYRSGVTAKTAALAADKAHAAIAFYDGTAWQFISAVAP